MYSSIHYRNYNPKLFIHSGGDKYFKQENYGEGYFYISFNIKGAGFLIEPNVRSYIQLIDTTDEEELEYYQDINICSVREI